MVILENEVHELRILMDIAVEFELPDVFDCVDNFLREPSCSRIWIFLLKLCPQTNDFVIHVERLLFVFTCCCISKNGKEEERPEE